LSFRVELHADVAEDLERIRAHLDRWKVDDAGGRLLGILAALRVLERSPRIGRPAGEHRELVIGEGAQVWVARYRVDALDRAVVVLAIRHGKEDGFRR